MLKKIICSLFLLTLLWSSPVTAEDDVMKAINEAIKQYNNSDYAGAASNLDYASQLIRQKKSEKMKELLPEPLAGWTGDPANAQAVGAAVFGGGLTVSREYRKDATVITVEIISDSPVLQSVMMMLNNPMFAGASGGTLETIAGQRAIIKYDSASSHGELNIVVAGRFMIVVKGDKAKRDDLIDYANEINYQALAGY